MYAKSIQQHCSVFESSYGVYFCLDYSCRLGVVQRFIKSDYQAYRFCSADRCHFGDPVYHDILAVENKRQRPSGSVLDFPKGEGLQRAVHLYGAEYDNVHAGRLYASVRLIRQAGEKDTLDDLSRLPAVDLYRGYTGDLLYRLRRYRRRYRKYIGYGYRQFFVSAIADVH